MTEIEYVGEHLLPGRIAQFSLLLSFCSSLFAAFTYLAAARSKDLTTKNNYTQWARRGFYIHAVALLTVIATLFYMMFNHMYEYRYVWEHVSDNLDMKYILAAFWEGQEGSLMLWMFWHLILGTVAVRICGKWESGVMGIVCLMQLVMGVMLLGVHIELGDTVIKLGSNPTLLLRDTMTIPIFNNAEYLSLITGNGLNPLLQNAWNTIHPPITFLGFASLTMPFAYAVSGLWSGEHKECMKESLKWSLFSTGILGSGIIMGSAWAYVALSFGGFWAWDPVENASLVPWLLIVAGLHTNYIAINTGRSIRSTYLFYIFALVLIIYSTFLTRSGVLGDTSAHAFTEMGLESQLIAFVLIFLGIGLISYFVNASSIPKKEEEESIYSREFWMFIGALVLLLSSLIISVSTSLPVFNSLVSYFDPNYIGKVIKDPITHYNKYQLWIALFMAILSASALFMRYRAQSAEYLSKSKFGKHMLFATLGGLALVAAYYSGFPQATWPYQLLLFALGFSMVASLDYILNVVKGNLKLGASALSHFGFSVMILGSLISGLNQHHISTNPFVYKEIFDDEDIKKYVSLIKGKPMFMSNYWVQYESDTLQGLTRTYNISFRKDSDSEEADFYVHPNIVYDQKFTKIAALNPSTKMFLTKDIFTDIAALHPSLQDVKFAKEMEDTMKFDKHYLTPGEPLELEEMEIELLGVNKDPKNKDYEHEKNNFGFEAELKVRDKSNDSISILRPALGLQGSLIYSYPIKSQEMEAVFKIDEEFFNQVYTPESQLNYLQFQLKEGESFRYEGLELKLLGFDRNINHKDYTEEDGDIAIAAMVNVSSNESKELLQPVFIVRGNKSFGLKEVSDLHNIHLRFLSLDPQTNVFNFAVAKEPIKSETLPLLLAENVDRTDYLIFQARVFPGINLFWIGSLLMTLGVFLALYQRNKVG